MQFDNINIIYFVQEVVTEIHCSWHTLSASGLFSEQG